MSHGKRETAATLFPWSVVVAWSGPAGPFAPADPAPGPLPATAATPPASDIYVHTWERKRTCQFKAICFHFAIRPAITLVSRSKNRI